MHPQDEACYILWSQIVVHKHQPKLTTCLNTAQGKHDILACAHPSGLSAQRGFYG